ncbi:DUF4113 domain-containing protein [Rhodoferax sp.]|uniref:DUF4113 domain-containing protein n=1 Tax=Rhodoferax sp. TaxID=50421 RepID=UPI00344F085C
MHRFHPPPDPLLLLVSKRQEGGYSHPNGWQAPEESFIDLTGIRGNMTERSQKIRSRILTWIGIACGIGIGPSKTLAKLANHIAKTAERKPGSYPAHHAQVCNLSEVTPAELVALLQATEVAEVWGVGRRLCKQLQEAGVHTALALAQLDPAMVKRRWSVLLERTVRELQGTDCIGLAHAPSAKQEIACTRSFGHAVLNLATLQEAVTEFACRAAQKLRLQHGHAGQVLTFIRTSPFRTQDIQYSRSTVVPLRRPSNDSRDITHAALCGLQAIFRPGYRYAKAGVMLLDLRPADLVQHELALDIPSGGASSAMGAQGERLHLDPVAGMQDGASATGSERLMQAMDTVNQRFGRGTLSLASAGLAAVPQHWHMKQERRTPGYTTDWHGLAWARA